MPSKRRNKKKNTNQSTTVSVPRPDVNIADQSNKENIDPAVSSTINTPPEVFSSPSSNDLGNTIANIPAGGPVGIGAKGALTSEVVDKAATGSEAFKPLPLHDAIQTSIDNAVGSRAIDTEGIINSIKQKVANGDYKEKKKEKEKEVAKKKVPEVSKPLPLPDIIQASIDNAVGSRAIDTEGIINSIKQKVANGDYKEKEKEKEKEVAKKKVSEVSKPLPLPDIIQASIDNAVGSRVIDTEEIISSVKQKVANGDYKENEKEVTRKKKSDGAAVSSEISKPLPLPDIIQASINNAVGSRVIDTEEIISSVKQKVVNGDYKEREKEATSRNTTSKVQKVNSTPRSADNNNLQTTAIGEGVPLGAPAAIAANDSKNPPEIPASGAANRSKKDTAAVAGVDAENTSAEETEKFIQESFSKNIEHGIKSVVDAAVVDVEKILYGNRLKQQTRQAQQTSNQSMDPNPQAPKKSIDIKRPEAAVGDTNQPAMPSSAKAADPPSASQSKPKSSGNRSSLLKKKNCIIL